MKHRLLHASRLLVLALASGAAASAAKAQADAGEVCKDHWRPERALTILIPRSPAAGAHGFSSVVADVIARQQGVEVRLANRLLGDPTGRTAATWFQSLPGDGYTILQNNDDIVSLSLDNGFGLDLLEVLKPVALMQVTFSQLYTRAGRFTRFEDLVAASRTDAGITIAHSGNDPSLETFLLDMLEAHGLCSNQRVAFESKSERYVELLTDSVDAVVDQPGDVRELTDQALIEPTISLWSGTPPGDILGAAGAPGVPPPYPNLRRLRGYFVHADIPADRLAFLQCALRQAYLSDEVRALNRKAFMDMDPQKYEAAFFDSKRSAEELHRMRDLYEKPPADRASQCP